MSFFKTADRIKQIDRYIKAQKTGNAEEMAAMIGVSRSRFFQILEEMRMLGAPIAYDADRRTYYYTVEGTFLIGFDPSEETCFESVE